MIKRVFAVMPAASAEDPTAIPPRGCQFIAAGTAREAEEKARELFEWDAFRTLDMGRYDEGDCVLEGRFSGERLSFRSPRVSALLTVL